MISLLLLPLLLPLLLLPLFRVIISYVANVCDRLGPGRRDHEELRPVALLPGRPAAVLLDTDIESRTICVCVHVYIYIYI